MLTFKQLEEKDGVVTFEQTGAAHTFTSEQLKQTAEALKKKRVEVTSQRDFEKAKMDNVSTNHPHVLELTDEQANAVSIFYQAKMKYEECLEIEKEIDKADERFKEDLHSIKEQTGFELA